jgi:hypothetical protein
MVLVLVRYHTILALSDLYAQTEHESSFDLSGQIVPASAFGPKSSDAHFNAPHTLPPENIFSIWSTIIASIFV